MADMQKRGTAHELARNSPAQFSCWYDTASNFQLRSPLRLVSSVSPTFIPSFLRKIARMDVAMHDIHYFHFLL
jgi:hypothetical protein